MGMSKKGRDSFPQQVAYSVRAAEYEKTSAATDLMLERKVKSLGRSM
jgi:hypothetical protein